MDFIFIGCIAEDRKIFWVIRNFENKPTNVIFSQKRHFDFSKMAVFRGVRSKINFERKPPWISYILMCF